VATLLYQLVTETERGCWRIDLYSLVDLWKYREFARPSFKATIAERAPDVVEAIRARRSDPFSAGWRELEEFAQIVRECGVDC
jgi:hypothetical protein